MFIRCSETRLDRLISERTASVSMHRLEGGEVRCGEELGVVTSDGTGDGQQRRPGGVWGGK